LTFNIENLRVYDYSNASSVVGGSDRPTKDNDERLLAMKRCDVCCTVLQHREPTLRYMMSWEHEKGPKSDCRISDARELRTMKLTRKFGSHRLRDHHRMTVD
jgi:hypothetical protein